MAPRLDKETIDALVDGMCPRVDYLVEIAGWSLFSGDVRRAMYKAAGLTAEGERKPERVKCWLWRHPQTNRTEAISLNSPVADTSYQVTPGWFVPDGAE